MSSLDHRIADGSSRAGVLKVLRERRGLMRVEDLAEAVNLSLSAVRFHLDRLIAEGLVRTAKEPRQTPGRPRVMYQAVPEEAVDDGAAYRRLAALLADELAGRGGATAAESAGRAWATQVVQARAAEAGAVGTAVQAPSVPLPVTRGDQGKDGKRHAKGHPHGHGRGHSAGRGDQAAPADLPDCLPDLLSVLEDGGFAPKVMEGGWGLELHRCPFADLMPDQAEVVCSVHKGLMQSLPELEGAVDRVRLQPMPDHDTPCIVHFVRTAAGH